MNKFFAKNFKFTEGLAPINKDDKWGYINILGELVIDYRFETAQCFSEGLALVSMDFKYGFIDKHGEFVIKPEFQFAQSFSEGMAAVCVESSWGFINKKGELIIEANFAGVKSFCEGLACVYHEKKYGFINTKGNFEINPVFDQAGNFSEGLAYASIANSRLWGFINHKGNFVISPQFSFAEDFSEGFATIRLGGNWEYSGDGEEFLTGGKWGMIDKRGRIKSGFLCTDFQDLNKSVALVKKDSMSSLMQFSDGEIAEFVSIKKLSFQGILRRIRINKKWGFINNDDKLIIENIYEEAGEFCEGLARVKFMGKWGFINEDGAFVVDPKYDFVSEFTNGLSKVNLMQKWGLIRKDGTFITDLEYDEIGELDYEFIKVTINNKCGWIDNWGNVIVPTHFEKSSFRASKCFVLEIQNKFVITDDKLKLIYDEIFDYVDTVGEDLFCVGIDEHSTIFRKRSFSQRKYKLINCFGEIINEKFPETLDVFSEGVVSVFNGEKYGFIDQSGNLVIPCVFDSVKEFSEGLCPVRFGKDYGYINKEGEVVIEPIFQRAYSFCGGVARIMIDDNWGFINTNGDFVVMPIFEYASDLINGMVKVCLFGKYGILSKDKCLRKYNALVEIKGSNEKTSKNNLTRLTKNKKLGNLYKTFVGTKEFVVDPLYQYIHKIENGTAIVTLDDKVRLINFQKRFKSSLNTKIDELVFPPILFDYFKNNETLVPFLKDPKSGYGYVNCDGEFVIRAAFDFAERFIGDTAIVKVNGRFGLINTRGDFILDPFYTDITRIGDRFLKVKIFSEINAWGIVDTHGNWIIKPEIKEIRKISDFIDQKVLSDSDYLLLGIEISEEFSDEIEEINKEIFIEPLYEDFMKLSEDRIAFKRNKKWGMLNLSGEEIVTSFSDEISEFSEGLAGFRFGNRWGFVNEDGEIIINQKFDDVQRFSQGLAGVKLNNKWGFIDCKGNTVINPEFDEVDRFFENTAKVKIGKIYGFIDISGKMVIEPSYLLANSFSNGRAFVLQDWKWKYIDERGANLG